MLKIKFNNKEYLFINDSLEEGGAITTREEFELFVPGYAHLFYDVSIKRYGEIIGTKDDIEVLEVIE